MKSLLQLSSCCLWYVVLNERDKELRLICHRHKDIQHKPHRCRDIQHKLYIQDKHIQHIQDQHILDQHIQAQHIQDQHILGQCSHNLHREEHHQTSCQGNVCTHIQHRGIHIQ